MAHLWLLAVLPLVAHAFNGIPADNQMVEMPGMVRYPITVVDGAPTKDRVFRRQTDVSLFPQKSGFFYSIEVKLGTPLQPVSVNFDTGSDELWVNPSCTKSADPTFCHKFGRFNGSQTFVDVKRNSTINYGTGFANLEFGYDYVQIGCKSMALTSTSNIWVYTHFHRLHATVSFSAALLRTHTDLLTTKLTTPYSQLPGSASSSSASPPTPSSLLPASSAPARTSTAGIAITPPSSTTWPRRVSPKAAPSPSISAP